MLPSLLSLLYSEEEVVEIQSMPEVETPSPSPEEAKEGWQMAPSQGVSKPFIIVIVPYFTFIRGCRLLFMGSSCLVVSSRGLGRIGSNVSEFTSE